MNPRLSGSAWRGLAGIVAVALVVAACGTSAGTSPSAASSQAAPTTAVTQAPTPEITDTPPDQVTGSLLVQDWTGYDAEWAWQDFKNTYKNVTVSFDFADSDADQFGKLKGGTQADIVHPYSGWLQPAPIAMSSLPSPSMS